jgi:hypothetical protein
MQQTVFSNRMELLVAHYRLSEERQALLVDGNRFKLLDLFLYRLDVVVRGHCHREYLIIWTRS